MKLMNFESLGLSAPICSAVAAAGYTDPTPVQARVVPDLRVGGPRGASCCRKRIGIEPPGVRDGVRGGDVPHIDLAEAQVLPRMRVGHAARPDAVRLPSAGAAMVVGVARHGARRDAVGRRHDRAAEAGGTDQPVHPAIEAEAVSHHQPRLAQRRHVGWPGLEAVRIDIRPGDDTQAERLSISTGERVSRQGRETYEVEYKLSDRFTLVGEYDEFDKYNAGVKWRMIAPEKKEAAREPPR